MSKAKRMIYIREENLEFYENLENKSDFINEALKLARLGGVDSLKVMEVGETHESVNNADNVVDAVEAMRQRDARRLAEYRKEHGLPDPTKAE